MKKSLLCFFLSLITFSLFAQPSPGSGNGERCNNGKKYKIDWTTNPFDYQVFIENVGQYDGKINSDEKVLFAARNGQAMAYFTNKGVVYRYDEFLDKKGRPVTSTAKKTEKKDKDEPGEDEEATDVPHYLTGNWQGSNAEVSITKEEKLPSYYTFPATKNMPFKTYGYKKLTYHNLYPGVDAIYSFVKGKEGFKYTLVVHPGSDLSKVKTAYEGEKNMHIDGRGNMVIECEWGKLTDANPVSHYEENGNNVHTSYSILNNNEESFNANNLSSSKTLIIDPAIVWTKVNPIVAANLGAFDVDYDYNGNVYVYGGTYPYQIVKLNAAGTILWTYTTANFTYSYYGDFCVDKNTGSVYACEGFGSTTGAITDKINNAGVYVSNYTSNSGEDEEWRIKYDLCNHQIVIAGGGTYDDNQGATLDTSMTTFTYVDVLGYPSNTYQYQYHDMCGIAMDPLGSKCYMAVAWTYSNSSIDNNTIIQMPLPTLSPTAYHAPDGFDFQEVASVTYPGALLANGMNCMAASPTWLYMYDGKTLKQFVPATGALNASTVIGATSFAWGGIDVDMCDNIYVGNQSNIYLYNSALGNTGTIAMPGTVYDIALGNGVLRYGGTTLYVSGNGFVSRVTVNPPNPPTITKVVTPGGCTPCTASAKATLMICGVPWAGPATYLWSNGQTTQTATNLCQGIDSVVITIGCGVRFSDTVNIPAGSGSLTLSTTVVNAGCASLGSATVTASGGTTPYTYVWSPSGGSNSTATGLSAGTYTVSVTDKNGCTNSTTVIVTSTASLTVSASNTNVLCNGGTTGTGTATVSGGTAPYTYSWSPGGNSNSTATGLSAGTYTVTVTDKNGCSGTVTVIITQPTAITSTTSSTQASCGNSNGSATVTLSGGTSPYTYSWAVGGATTSTASGLSAGTFTVYVTDNNGCTYSTTVIVTTSASVTATISASTGVLCNGGSTGTATVTASNGTAPYTYAWSPSGGSGSTGTGLSAGTYTVTVTDKNGCTATTSVIITQPTAITSTTSSTQSTCGNSNGSATATISGGTGAYTYSWAAGGATTSTATGLSAGTYTVYVTDNNGCTYSTTVVVNTTTSVTATISSSTDVLCNGGSTGSASVSVSGGTAPYTYTWTPAGGIGSTATGLSAGTYTVTVTDVNGCTGTASVIITQPPLLSVSAGAGGNVLCNGGTTGSASSTATGGTAPYTYAWTPSVGNASSASGLSAGTYTLTVTDANGCTATASVIITQPTALSVSTTVVANVSCNGGSNGSANATATGGTSPYTYAWTPSGGNNSNASNLSAGTYTITITDANGCTATSSAIITEPPVLSATTSSTAASCNLSNGSVTATVTGGTPVYIYSWVAGGGTTSTVSGLSIGTYTVYITDANGCTFSTTATITQPSAVAVTISASTNVSCNGGANGSATASASGGTGPYTYAWTPSGGNSSTASGLSAGTYTVTVTDANGCVITASVTITEPPVLSASASVTANVSCNAGSNGSANATATGGTSPYTYSWSPSNQSASTATGLSTGTYTITITDANGCTATSTAIITEPPVLTVTTAVTENISCNGGSNGAATAAATGGTSPYTYAWTPAGGNSSVATSLSAGTYTVTITDANGCTATASTIITEPPVLSATTSFTAASCNLSNGSVTAIVTGGTPAYTYSWVAGGGTTSTVSSLSIGTYTVYITDANGCTYSTTATITQPSAVAVTISGSTNVSCNGGTNGSATASASGGTGPYTYAWNPSGGNSSTATGLSAGTYTVTVTDANGCVITTSVIITQPTLLTVSTGVSVNVSCNGGANGSATATASGGTSPYNYAWTPSGGNASSASGLSAGTYTITITDANGCSATASAIITQPTSVTATIGSITNVTCFGDNNGTASVNVTGGNSPYTYTWNPSGGNGSSATGLTAGSYTVNVTDASGCTATAVITITQPALLTTTLTTTNIACNGGNSGSITSATSGGTVPYTYAWSNGKTTTNLSNLSSGTYTVTITDANGCTVTGSATITEPPTLSVTASGPQSVCSGAPATLVANASGGTLPYTYLWSPGGGTTATVTTNPVNTTTYTVTVTDANGCTASATVTVYVSPPLSLIVIGDTLVCPGQNVTLKATGSGGDGIYHYLWLPSNITSQIVSFNPTQDTTITIELTDDCGSTMLTKTIHITVEPLPLPVFSDNPGNGCYPLCIQFRDLSSTSFGAITSWGWNFGDGDTSDVQNPIYCYNDTGTFTVTLTIATAGGCSSTITKPNIIKVYPHPHADFTWTPQPVTVLSSNVQFIDKSTDPYKIIQWFWNFEDGSGSSDENPIHAYGDTGTFCTHLMVMDIHGCFDSTTKCLDVEPSYTFWIPDAFTPNGDGINDVFQPKGTYIRSYEMFIFDRWGEKLFHTDDFYTGWNGTVNNAGPLCQEDTYVYIMYVFDTQGNKHTYTGKVSLIR